MALFLQFAYKNVVAIAVAVGTLSKKHIAIA